jgi:hypothetical protein
LLPALVVTTLVLQPAVPAAAATPELDLAGAIDRVRAELAVPPDLSQRSEAPADAAVFAPATTDATGIGIDAVSPPVITCRVSITDPHVAPDPTKIRATTRINCDFPLPVQVAGVAMYRQGTSTSTSSNLATRFLQQSAVVHTFTTCRTSAYFAIGTGTLFAPPGYTPSVAHVTVLSNLVLLAAADESVKPLVCQRPPQPTPQPPPNPPSPGPAPVINSLLCEYLGSNRYLCSLNATGWTQIRWQYNSSNLTARNDMTSTGIATCSGTPTITVYVSNLYGATTAKRTFRCDGQPL